MNPNILSLKTAAEIAAAKVPANSPSLPVGYESLRAIANRASFDAAVAEGVRRVVALEYLSFDDLADGTLAYHIGEALVVSRHFFSVAEAQAYLGILQTEVGGGFLSAPVKEWLAGQRRHIEETTILRRQREAAFAQQQAIAAAEKEVAAIVAALIRERQRVENYSCVDGKGRENYFALYVNGEQGFVSDGRVEFIKQWMAERELLRFTRDEVIPALVVRLAAGIARRDACKLACSDQLPAVPEGGRATG